MASPNTRFSMMFFLVLDEISVMNVTVISHIDSCLKDIVTETMQLQGVQFISYSCDEMSFQKRK
jgi:hypothetical protein